MINSRKDIWIRHDEYKVWCANQAFPMFPSYQGFHTWLLLTDEKREAEQIAAQEALCCR